MAVEILILSGSRQGTRLVLDGRLFRVGTEPGCEVAFDPQQDPSAQDRAALVQQEDDGWYLRSTGAGELILNQQTVVEPRRLQSGDVVRLSATGPDFCFRLVTSGVELPRPADSGGPPPATTPSAVPPPESKPLPLAEGTSAAAATSASSSPIPPVSNPWAKWAAAALGACLVAALVWRILQPPPTPQVTIHVGQHAATASQQVPTAEKTELESQPPKPETSTVPVTKPSSARPAVSPPTPPAAESPFVQLRRTVYLVEVEKAGRRWPFASCVAVGHQTLLTSAREAMQLAAWQKNDGFTLWVVHSTLNIQKEIREIRLHGMFAALAEKPNDWIYYNLALLSVEGDLPAIAPLASSEELGNLKEDSTVMCLGFAHEGKKTSSARPLEATLFPGNILMTTVAQALPSRPRLLHIDAPIPQNVYGSPLFNETGHVVGVYGTAAAPDDAATKNLHLASVTVAEVIRLWTEKRDEKLWVLPTVLNFVAQPGTEPSRRVPPSTNKGS